MTAYPDHSALDDDRAKAAADLAAYYTAVQGQIDSLSAQLATAQASLADDASSIASLNAEITDLQAQVATLTQELADCQNSNPTPPPPPAPAVIFGANCGGYYGEGPTHAYQRIDGHWKLGMVRSWANNIFDRANAPFAGTGLPLCIEMSADPATVMGGSLDAKIIACLQSLLDGDVISYNHEYDLDANATTTAKQAAQHFSDLCKANKPAGAFSTIILTGGAYIGRGDVPWDQCWPDNPDGIDLVGADSYQHGTTDTNADSAETILGGVFAAASQLGKPVIFAELGARSGGTAVTDSARAKFLTDACAMMRDPANPATHAALYYESYRGSLGPWNLLETSATSGVFSPLAAKVWADACATNA